MSYHIEINEYQRRLIMKALTSTDVNQFSQAPGSGDAFDTEAKEFVCLVQMFGTLDLDDTAHGGLKLFSANVIRHDYARMSAGGDRTAWLGM
jgi:hypothetical protein